MQTLGDILNDALKQKETNMRTFDVSLSVQENGKKITAIKEIRHAFGIGLAEAKHFVEAQDYSWGEPQPRMVRLNEEQLRRFLLLTVTNQPFEPQFTVEKVTELFPTPRANTDYSATVPAPIPL